MQGEGRFEIPTVYDQSPTQTEYEEEEEEEKEEGNAGGKERILSL